MAIDFNSNSYRKAGKNASSYLGLMKMAQFYTGYTGRKLELYFYDLVLTGEHYNLLNYQFTHNDPGVSMHEKAPSIKYNLCSKVAEDSAGLLFADSHFPMISCKDEETRDVIRLITKAAKLPEVMLEAATFGSIGSVAILVGVVSEQIFFKVLKTINLTPVYDNDKTKNLVKVIEEKTFRGDDLKTLGYTIKKELLSEAFVVIREWNSSEEIVYHPVLKYEFDNNFDYSKLRIDKERTTSHNLGFVPIVWIKNLPCEDIIDGDCTFRKAIDISLQIDYLLSQGARGLYYSSEPTLVLKKPNVPMGSALVYGNGNVIDLPPDGDAKLLELEGGAVQSIVAYVKALREFGLESIHGNRVDTSKLSVAQSGKAMEMMIEDLIWLTDKLRISYGEIGLVKLICMSLKIINKTKVKVSGKYLPDVKEDEIITLVWSSWFSATPDDVQKLSVGNSNLYNNGLLSKKTIVDNLSPIFHIEDASKEIDQIDEDIKGELDNARREQAISGNQPANGNKDSTKGAISGDQPSAKQRK